MIEIKNFNLKKMNLNQKYKLYSSEMFKGTITRDLTVTMGTSVATIMVINNILNSYPEERQFAGFLGFAIPTTLMTLYRGAIELIKMNKKAEALELLETLKKALSDHNIEVDFRGFDDLHRISVPYDLYQSSTSEEDFDDNYFWFRDKNDKIQAIHQERDKRSKTKRLKYSLLEESDEELKYIRIIAR